MAEHDDELDLPGLGSVRLVRRGSSSSLYRGRQVRFDRDVAVKLLPGRVDGDRRDRFDRECAAMGPLSAHPHVVTVFESGVTRKGAYLVSEWLAGGDFAALLARGPRLGWREAVDTGIKLAGALESAHRAGVLHDNLKPQNVLRSSFGDAVLGDLALGGPTDTRSSDTYDTSVHAAPERFEGAGPSVLADVYALASVIVTFMLGRPPFASAIDEPLVRISARKAAGAPADLRLEEVPDGVCRALEAALSVAAADRPSSAARLGRALQAAQEAAGGVATRMVVFPETADDVAPAPVSARLGVPVHVGPPERDEAPQSPVEVGPARAFPDQVRSVLGVAVDRYRDRAAGARLGVLRSQLRDPVRIVFAGPAGGGKSTLVNGIIGHQVAPTGRGAGLGVTHWYSSGPSYRATARSASGDERPVPMSRHGQGVELDLAGLEHTPIDHVEVAWPSASLAGLVLIDGPVQAVAADALVYVTPALAAADLLQLEKAQAALPPATAALTTIVVLAPSGPGAEQWAETQAEAERLRADPQARRRAQTVVAVSAALGASASVLAPDDPAAVAGDALVHDRSRAEGGSTSEDSARSGDLVRRSGLQGLRDVITTVVVPRCEVIRAEAALGELASALVQDPVAGGDRLAFDLEQTLATAHEVVELRHLASVRDGSAGLPRAVATEADHLLGGAGPAPAARLGLPADADAEQVALVLAGALADWRRRAESPVGSRAEVIAARAVVRSGEGMARSLAGPG